MLFDFINKTTPSDLTYCQFGANIHFTHQSNKVGRIHQISRSRASGTLQRSDVGFTMTHIQELRRVVTFRLQYLRSVEFIR